MPKSVSIPIALSELKRTSFQRLSSKKGKKEEKKPPMDMPIGRFVILVQETGQDQVRLFSGSPNLDIGDEIIGINDVQILGKKREEVLEYVQECIRKKVIQLKIRRRLSTIVAPGVVEGPSTSNPLITDAFLVSVDKENTKELIDKLERLYPSIRTFDMESIAVGKPLSSIQSTSLTEEKRLKQYENERQERLNTKLQRQKENEFLRKSLRSSKKLKSLAISKENSPNIASDITDVAGKSYVNESCDEKEDNNNEAIPLNQVIVSVDRLTDHLSRMAGNEDDVKVLRDFFQSQPIQEAIQETASRRGGENTKNRDSSASNQVQNASEPNISSSDSSVRVVTFHKEEDTYLGATVRNEDNRIIVGRVVQGGIVEKTGLFRQGDELLEMNGVELRGKKVGEVCELLRNLSGEVRFVVSSSTENGEEKQTGPATIQHFRALFDYDPEDDKYIPCKELALKFERGDILHVLNKTDENWWQAYREGEDTIHQLAGLIPSSSFHQQVVMYTEEIDKEFRPKRKNPNKLIPEVIRTLGRKSGREVQRSVDEGGTSNTFGFHSDLLTYEEVVYHLSRSDHHRPLVLCGPEGVGCLLLRQRLLESDTQRLASPVPYTTREPREGEIDHVHYHFISKQQFMEYSRAGKFVEFGEYQKHMYGTAKQDIINVINRGKTCIFTLKPESLYLVRLKEIMPYIAFIAPPSLVVLRKQREHQGQFDVKDQQLKSILNQGKLIEQKYGHLFDAIVVNTDYERSLSELKAIVRKLDTEPHWVPSTWIEE
ncbi:unnamed protein product [Auanema sp. JU1783]|nr:unnamed protein product [Auanema sp. JU1783]